MKCEDVSVGVGCLVPVGGGQLVLHSNCDPRWAPRHQRLLKGSAPRHLPPPPAQQQAPNVCWMSNKTERSPKRTHPGVRVEFLERPFTLSVLVLSPFKAPSILSADERVVTEAYHAVLLWHGSTPQGDREPIRRPLD